MDIRKAIRRANTISNIFIWLALISALAGIAMCPGSRPAWFCASLWIVNCMMLNKSYTKLEDEATSLASDNSMLYSEILRLRKSAQDKCDDESMNEAESK